MKHTVEVTELSGFNESPIAGNFIKSSRDFDTRNVTVGVSVLTNSMTGLSGTVTAVSDETITAAGMSFSPGDFFYVTLSAPWTLQNSDMPIIEVECKVCGFSYPRKQLVRGICSVCLDKIRPKR